MIAVLTSGVALGVHVPGLLLRDRLRERGIPAEVFVLERLLPERKAKTAADLKWAFHRDFRFALAGQRIAANPADAVAEDAIRDFATSLVAAGTRRLVLFSGFWLTVAERVLSLWPGEPPRVDVCHVDSVDSPSFRGEAGLDLCIRRIRLADADLGILPWTIPVTHEPAPRWEERSRRLFVHGGGWGMGDYRDRARELADAGFGLDLVAYESHELSEIGTDLRYFMLDPQWHPWHDNGYPPFGQVDPETGPRFTRGTAHHGSFDVARSAIGMVSKPGGGTLLDSLWSATPVIFSEPFGAHERRNAELWTRLGFGVHFEEWRSGGFDPRVLESCHHALLERARAVPGYPETLAGEYGPEAVVPAEAGYR